MANSPDERRYLPDTLSVKELNSFIVGIYELLRAMSVDGVALTDASPAWSSVALSLRRRGRRRRSLFQEEGRLVLARGGALAELPTGGLECLTYFVLGAISG